MPKHKKSKVLRRLWKYLCRYKWLALLALLLAVTSNLLTLLGPLLSGYAIDAIEPGEGAVDFDSVFYYAALMLVFYVTSAVLNYILALILIKFGRNVVYRMRKDVFDRLITLPVSFFDRTQAGDVISVISYDIDTINASLSNDLLQMLTSTIVVVGSFSMMLAISPVLTLVFVITIPISVILTHYMTKRIKPLYRNRSYRLGALNGFVEEYTDGLKTIKAYHQEKTVTGKFDEKNHEAVEAYYKADYVGSMMGPSVNFINNLSLALVSMLGAILYMNGSLSLGDISSFVLYSRKFSGPINEFANIISELQSSLAAAERVFRLLDELPEPADSPNAIEMNNVSGSILMDKVSFGYSENELILRDLSLHAEKGSVIAIVGPTGAGKTTIVNLLMRFYDISSGSILMDGTDIRGLTRTSLRAAYAMVLQDTWLFHGTVYENLAYGKEGVTPEEVMAAAKAAKIHRYISTLPDGYNTVLSDNGVNISKGQKQLLTIARAMLLDSTMLILDEATSNVDTQTERRIQAAMLRLMSGKTCFIIAHRLSTIQNADLILVLKDGRVVERGRHDELLGRRGIYYELYNSQFE